MTLALFVIGCVEWLLAAVRTVTCASGRAKVAAALVFCETVLGLGVLRYVVLDNSWGGIAAYSLGGALGMWYGCRRTRQ
jgi:hypothetical protein